MRQTCALLTIVFIPLAIFTFTPGPVTLAVATAGNSAQSDGAEIAAPETRPHLPPSVEPRSGRSPFCSVCTDNRYCCAGVEYCSRSPDGRTVICVDAAQITLIHDETDGTTTVTEIDAPALLGLLIGALCRS